jgi:arylsulfatase A-like enzyme
MTSKMKTASSRSASKRPIEAKSRRRALTAIVLLSATLLSAVIAFHGCGRTPPQPLNIVFIIMDTLRAQSMSLYDAQSRTTPYFVQFARYATLYDRSIASSPWTLPTHASMFTGLFPSEHGARIFKESDTEFPIGKLKDEFVTLAEYLRERGYETAGFTANTGFLNPVWGLNQGFDMWFNRRLPARELNRGFVFPWLRRKEPDPGDGDGKPWFLFINYMDTHEPYNTTPVASYPDTLTNRNSREVLESVRYPVMMKERPLPEARLKMLEEQYNVAVANVDEALRDLMNLMTELKLLDRTLIVVTSDHGEYFGEHDLITHWKELYQPVLWVPLVVKKPGQLEGNISHEVISSVDLPRLILENAGLYDPSGGSGRTDELPPGFLRQPGNHDVMSEIHFIGNDVIQSRPWGRRLERERISRVEWPWKCIWSSDGDFELYNLETDPRERRNEIDNEKMIAEKMLSQIDEYMAKTGGSPASVESPKLTEDDLRKLRALGYVGN